MLTAPHTSPSPAPTLKRRIVSIQVGRGLAALVVVLAHLHNVELKYFYTHFLDSFQFGVLGVDLFFVISGVVISSVALGKFGSAPNALNFIYNRLARIFPVYWVYSAVVFAAFLYDPLWINANSGHQVDVLPSFLLIPTSHPMLIMQGWTLTFELYFYVVFALLLLFPGRWAKYVLVLWGALEIALRLYTHDVGSPIVQILMSPLIFEFMAGCVIYWIYSRARLHPSAGVILVTLSLVWFGWLYVLTLRFHGFNQDWIEHSIVLRPEFYGVFAAMFLLGLVELERTNLIRFSQPFAKLGDWSYSIYLSHLIVIELFGRMFVHLVGAGPYVMLAVVAVTLPAVILVGYLSFRLVETPLLRLLYRPSVPGLQAPPPPSKEAHFVR